MLVQEHLIIVSELLKDNLYEFQKYIRDSGADPYFTLPNLRTIMTQCLEALAFIHSLQLMHCDIKVRILSTIVTVFLPVRLYSPPISPQPPPLVLPSPRTS